MIRSRYRKKREQDMNRARGLGLAIIGALAMGTMAGTVQAQTTRPSNGPTTRESVRRTAAPVDDSDRCMLQLRSISQALVLYCNEHKGRLPADLGTTLDDLYPVEQLGMSVNLTPAQKASFYLCPSHAKGVEIPEEPTAEWVNQNTSYVYLGGSKVDLPKLRGIAQTVLMHEKPEAAHPGGKIWVAFADGHCVLMPVKEALQAVEESKPRIAAAAQ
jgi:hypothetical protein